MVAGLVLSVGGMSIKHMSEKDHPHTKRGRKTPATFYTSQHGYEKWDDGVGKDQLMSHRLLAIHKYGFDAVCGKVVHHKNGIPWDNRTENIKILERDQHSRLHALENLELGILSPGVITKKECAKLRQEYEGTTIQELAREYTVSNSCIYEHLNADCAHTNESVTNGWNGPRDGPWRDKELFDRLYNDFGCTLHELSNMWGCSKSTASNWKQRHGF